MDGFMPQVIEKCCPRAAAGSHHIGVVELRIGARYADAGGPDLRRGGQRVGDRRIAPRLSADSPWRNRTAATIGRATGCGSWRAADAGCERL